MHTIWRPRKSKRRRVSFGVRGVERLEVREVPSAAGAGHLATAAHSVTPSKTPETVSVPLSWVPITNEGERLAISVGVAGGTPQPYLLDTGSSGMYVANSQISSSDYTTKKSFSKKYSSGISYKGVKILTSVDFGQGADASNVELGLIKTATGNLVSSWKSNLRKHVPPYQNAFYGTLGISLEPGHKTKQSALYNVIAQLPGNLNSGFIVHTGGSAGTDPTLTIGLTPENTQGFITVPMPAAGAAGTTYTHGNGAKNRVLAWNDKGVVANYTIPGMPAFSAPTVFDSGEQKTVLYTGNVPKALNSSGKLKTGTSFAAQIANGVTWQFRAGNTINVNEVGIGAKRKTPTVNTGIGIFLSYDVMYDIRDGLLGFRPVTSETSA